MGMDWDEIREIESRILDFEDNNQKLEAENQRLKKVIDRIKNELKEYQAYKKCENENREWMIKGKIEAYEDILMWFQGKGCVRDGL